MIITTSTKKKKKEEDIAPVKETTQEPVKKNKVVKKSSHFDDGYDFGDVTKTILSTTGDLFANVGKGFMNTVEGVVDTARIGFGDLTKKSANVQADIWDFFGNESYASNLRKAGQDVKDLTYRNATMDVTGALLGENKLLFKDNWSKKLNEGSVAGTMVNSVEQGIGNIGAFVGLSGIGGLGANALGLEGASAQALTSLTSSNAATFGNSFTSAYGNTLTNGLRNGLDEKEAKGQAITSGLAEAISEQFFQGIPGLKSAGWADNLISKPISKYFSGATGKVALKIFDSLGEGFEEVISNVLQSTFEGIRKGDNIKAIWDDATGQITNEETRDAFISALISSALTNGGSALITNAQKNQIIDTYAKENGITKEQTKELFDAIVEKKANLEETSNYKERVETEEGISKQLVKDIKEAQKNGKQLDLNELFEQTPNSVKEMQFRFNQDEAKNVKSEKQNILANDMARLNNEKSNHELYKVVNAIQSANDTQQYHITTTEGLYEMGIVNKDENGNYTMPDGSPYVPRGLNYKNGEIYINADVGSQSGTQAVYHEMFEGFKKAAPEQYNEFKQMVTDIIGEDAIQKEFDTYKSMYGEELTDDIRDEIINDKFGELAENQNFINKIADNRNVLEKFIDSIKNMIKYVKGTDEERQLMKLQKNLEKEFAKRYKETDFSQGKGDTAYSLKERVENQAEKAMKQDIANYNSIRETILDYVAENNLKNPSVDEMLNAMDDYNMLDYADYDLQDYKQAQKLFKEVAQEIYNENNNTDTKYSLAKHYGDLGKGNDTYYTNMSGDRNTGHFGTGTYFVNEEYQSGETSSYANRPVNKVEFDNYNLYKPRTESEGFNLHDGLKAINSKVLFEKDTIDNFRKGLNKYNDELSQESIDNLMNLLEQNDYQVDDIKRLFEERNDTQAEKRLIDRVEDIIDDYDRQYRNYRNMVMDIRDTNTNLSAEDIYNAFEKARATLNEYNKEGYKYGQYPTAEVDSLSTIFMKELGYNGIDVRDFDGLDNTTYGSVIYDLDNKKNTLSQQVERQATKIMEDAENKRTAMINSFAEYLEENNITNPTQQDIDNSLIDLLGYDNEQTDIENVKDEKLYNQYAREYMKENNIPFSNIKYSLTGNVESFTTPYGVEVVKNPTNEQYQEMRNELLHQYPWLMGTGEVLLRHTYDEEGNEYYWSSFDAQHSAVEPYINKLYNTRTNQNYKWYEKENKDDYPTDYSWVDTSNFNPKYSLTSNENIDSKEIAPVGSTVEETIAPIREDISNLTEKIDNLSTQLETMQNEAENKPSGYVETYKPSKNEKSTPLTENDAEVYNNALMNDEGYLKSLEESNYNEIGSIENDNATKIANRVGNELALNSKQVIALRDSIQKYATEQYTTDEILRDLSMEYGSVKYEEIRDEIRDAKKIIRKYPIKVSQNIKNDIADYGDFKKSNFGKILFSNYGRDVDTVYEELANGELQGIIDKDITNPTDQLLELSRVANESIKHESEFVIPEDKLETMADFIHENIINAKYAEQNASINALDNAIENYEEIAPTTIRTQESIDNAIENRDIAPIRQDVVDKQNPENQNKKSKAWQTFQETMVNRNYVIDKLAKETGNNDVKYKGDAWNNVSSEAQYNINNYQTDNNYNRVGKSVKELFEPAKNEGLYDAYNDYLIQKSNIERTNQGKGSAIPYEISVQLVSMYEQEHPQFKTWAKDIYKYFDNVLQDQVDSGLITQEEYNHFRGENGIYRSYVPFYPGEFVASRYFDNEGKLRTPTTLKRSKGGIQNILAVEDSMMKQTYAYKSAIRQNDFFNEIVSTLGQNDNGLAAELRGNPTDRDMSLFIDPETNDKYVVAYVDGDAYSSKISDELYNELGKISENQFKDLENNLSGILNPIQKVSNVRRNLLTAWNPVFLLRNGIKDIQDAVINSKQTGQMLKSYFGIGEKAAILELKEGTSKEAQQFMAAYGTEGTYGDYTGNTKSKVINTISNLNELIELAPRFAEFKATIKNGGSIQEALYNAREVTTNFGRGGYVAKAMNRNGFTFLNANIQGLDKIVRNLSGENGAKGVVSVVAKGALFGIAPAILNELLFGAGDDKDEEYEALPDYIKDNYYLIKLDSGKFLRIPKGRVTSVLGSAARRTIEMAEGEENAFEGYGENAWSQIGVGDSGGLQTIFTPLNQARKNEAWYGGDIVPTRLQNLPAEEQYDEKTDAISKKIGEIFKVSPKKVNYVLDQYSGGIGDLLLPTMTPATSNGAEGLGYLTAPLSDAFVVNSTDDNKYASEFYTLKDELQKQSNSSKATDEEKLRYKYINSVNSELSDLYKERREVQADTTLSKKDKYKKVQAIQDEINSLAKEGVATSKIVEQTDNYAKVGDNEYYLNDENEWTKLNENDTLDTVGMTSSEKSTYFKAKDLISSYNKEYKAKTENLDKNQDKTKIEEYAYEKKQNTIQAIINSGLTNEDKAILYSNYYSNEETMNNFVNAGYDIDTYITATNDIDTLRNKYSKDNGYSTAYRKNLTVSYVDSLNMSDVQKAILLRQYYTSFDDYNYKIVNYVSGLDISYEEKLELLRQCKFKVDNNGNISW